MQAIPNTAKFYITKNFYNDINGNPRKFYELYDAEINYLGYCKDNYAGENFTYGRDLKKIGKTVLNRGGYREYIKGLKSCTEFKNEGLK
jgi:hypothetical protein